MKKPVTNIAASVRDRLLHDTKRRSGNFQRALQGYMVERFLYRLGQSKYRDQFVLKGAMLFVLWDATLNRPTKDLDLAGYWTNDASSLLTAIREVLVIPCPEDGVAFAADSITAEPIRDRSEYHGFRLRVVGTLATAKVSLQIDVGFGDAIEPPATLENYPVVLDAPIPHIRAYPREVSIAEKLQAMVSLGIENSRLKDFYDVHLLSSRFPFSGERLSAAIHATFARRKTSPVEPWPVALTHSFYEDANRGESWRRFLQRANLRGDAPEDFALVGERIQAFLEPPLRAMQRDHAYVAAWPAGGPWHS